MEKKKIIVIISALLLSISIITASYFIAEFRRNEDTRLKKEETHSMYIKINPLVKINFTENYYLCKDNKEKACGKSFYRVTGFELINEDAKKIYKDLDLEDEDLYRAILTLCDKAISNKIVFNRIEITTDSSSIVDSNVLNYIKNNSDNKINYLVHVNYQKTINEKKILQEESTGIKTYLVVFNSNGGNKINSQIIEEGKMASKPNNPTRNGYSFVEWRLNGVAFNFNTKISNDITLEAVWEKEDTTKKQNENQQNTYTAPSTNGQENNSNPVMGGGENSGSGSATEGQQEPSVDNNPTDEETPTVPEETPKEPVPTDEPSTPEQPQQ